MKRAHAALAKEQAARSAARQAVYAALWARPAYVRMHARLDARNAECTREETDMLLGLGSADRVAAAKRRFSRYCRRIQAVENAALAAALAAAGLTP
jgi:hypothetical protein